MKYIHVYGLFLISVFHTFCGQNQTNVSKDNIKSETKDTVTSYGPNSMVRNVKKDRNGNILIASYLGVFRYDGTSFTNISSKISPPIFSSSWDVLEDRKGSLWLGTKDSGVYCCPSAPLRAGGKSFQHFTTKDRLGVNSALHFGYQAYYLQFIYKGYIFIYNANPLRRKIAK
jgi:ligand-binding sensor domain-containing protein